MTIEALGNEAMHCLLKGDQEAFNETFLSKCDPQTVRAIYQVTRDLANQAFAKGAYDQALQHYTGLLALAPSNSERAKLFSNRSLCCLKLRRFEDAVEEAKKAIASDPNWDKPWFRAGRAFFELHKIPETLAAARYALKLRGFLDPNDVVTSEPEVKDILNLYRLALQEDIKIKRRQRYETNYDRFHKLADELTALEAAAEQAEMGSQPLIEFAPGLTEEQKMALTLQLTGQYDERLSAKLLRDAEQRVVINLSVDAATTADPKHQMALGSLLQVQYEAGYGTRLLTLLDTGLAAQWARWTLKAAADAHSVVFLGFESILPAAAALVARKRVHLCSRSVTPAALDFLMRVLEANDAVPPEVLVHSRRELLWPSVPAEQETATPSDSEADEAELAARGGNLLTRQMTPVPRNPELVVLDPATLEPYLLGPLNPLPDLRSFKHIARLFPAKTALFAELGTVRLPAPLADSLAVQSGLQWSLLPQRLPAGCEFEPAACDPFPLYTLHAASLAPPTDSSFALTAPAAANAVRFYLVVEDESVGLHVDSRRLEEGTAFWWLSRRTDAQPDRVEFRFCNGQLGAVRLLAADAVVMQSDPLVCNSCDRYLWANQLDGQRYAAWAAALAAFRDLVLSKEAQTAQSRLVARDAQPTDVDFLHLDAGSLPSALAAITAILRKQSATTHAVSAAHTRLLTFDSSQGSCRLIKGALRSPSVLDYVRSKCWEDEPALAVNKTEWRNAAGELIRQHVDVTEQQTQVRDWLLARDGQRAVNLGVECGGVRTLRPPAETPDTRMALCALFGVGPDTPGLDSATGCHVLDRLASGVIVGDPATLPPDGLSQGVIPTVLYAKRALTKKHVRFFPCKLSIMAMLVDLPDSVEVAEGVTVKVAALNAARNPARSAGAAANALPDSHCFNYGLRTSVRWAELEGATQVTSAPILVAYFDYENPEEARLLAPLLKARMLPVPAAPGQRANGAVIWAEWTLVPGTVIGNPPPCFSHRVALVTDTVQAFQLLPRRQVRDLQFLPLPSFTDFVLTWQPSTDDPSYLPRDEQQLAASTSMILAAIAVKQDELAMQLGQQLLTSPKTAKELATTAMALVREGEDSVCNHLFDSNVVNNLLYATLA